MLLLSLSLSWFMNFSFFLKEDLNARGNVSASFNIQLNELSESRYLFNCFEITSTRGDPHAGIYPDTPAINQRFRMVAEPCEKKQELKVDRKGRSLPDVIPQIRFGFRPSEHDRHRESSM